jgi:hypothetical protein
MRPIFAFLKARHGEGGSSDDLGRAVAFGSDRTMRHPELEDNSALTLSEVKLGRRSGEFTRRLHLCLALVRFQMIAPQLLALDTPKCAVDYLFRQAIIDHMNDKPAPQSPSTTSVSTVSHPGHMRSCCKQSRVKSARLTPIVYLTIPTEQRPFVAALSIGLIRDRRRSQSKLRLPAAPAVPWQRARARCGWNWWPRLPYQSANPRESCPGFHDTHVKSSASNCCEACQVTTLSCSSRSRTLAPDRRWRGKRAIHRS